MLDLTDIVQRSAAILRQKTKYTFVAPMSPFPQRKNCVREDEVAHYNDMLPAAMAAAGIRIQD